MSISSTFVSDEICFLTADISIFDGCIVIYKFIQDLHFYVTGSDDENELILGTVLQGFFDAAAILLRWFTF